MTGLVSMSCNPDVPSSVPTVFLLLAQYGGRVTIPVDWLVRDFFGHLTVEQFVRKALRGDIPIPIIRIETSQKSQKHVALKDLAAYLDERREAALKELAQVNRDRD